MTAIGGEALIGVNLAARGEEPLPPILLRGQEAFITTSIGISIYPSDSGNAESLISNADTAMYRAKQEGGNRYRFFTPEMNTPAAGWPAGNGKRPVPRAGAGRIYSVVPSQG